MAVAMKEGLAGRPQEQAMTGPGYRLAEYLNKHWDRVGQTNQELAIEWNYKSPGLISMWRTGKSRVPAERIPDLARKLRVDLAVLLPLWIDQFAPNREGAIKLGREFEAVFKRLATKGEFIVLQALRSAAKTKGQIDADYSEDQVRAFEQIAMSEDFAKFVMEEGAKQGLIQAVEQADD